jgi:hypothetical protein
VAHVLNRFTFDELAATAIYARVIENEMTTNKLDKRLNKSGSLRKLESKPGKPVWTSDNCPLVVCFCDAGLRCS